MTKLYIRNTVCMFKLLMAALTQGYVSLIFGNAFQCLGLLNELHLFTSELWGHVWLKLLTIH